MLGETKTPGPVCRRDVAGGGCCDLCPGAGGQPVSRVLAAYIANPLVSQGQRVGVPRSATIPLLLLVLAVAALAFVLVPMAQREFTTFTAHAPAYTFS